MAKAIHNGQDRPLVESDGAGGQTPYVLATNPDGTNIGGTGGTSHTDDAAFTAAVDDGTIAMGVYQSTVDEVDAGDGGALRMTARRALVNAPDYYSKYFEAADVNASPKTVDGITFTALRALKLGSTDGVAYGTTGTILINLGNLGFRNVSVGFKNGVTSHDQIVTCNVYVKDRDGQLAGKVASFAIPTTNLLQWYLTSRGAVGQGGVAGGSTASNQCVYSVPAMECAEAVYLEFTATLPTTGAFYEISIQRQA